MTGAVLRSALPFLFFLAAVALGARSATAETLYGLDRTEEDLETVHREFGASLSTIGPLIEAASTVAKVFGLAMHPNDGTMFISYQLAAGVWRIGTVNLSTAAVTLSDDR